MQRHAVWIALVLCVALAAWVGVAEGVHEMHNGDTFVPALTSLQERTFFYWQQNRYGMLIPALTRPLDDPLAVLVAQLVISSAFGLLAFFAVARAALERWLRRAGGRVLVAEGLALILLVAAVGDRFGNPAPGRVGAEVDRRFGARTPELLALGADLVVGDYWNVWPMVFHANRVLHARGEAREIHGLTHRAWPTRARWEPLFRCDAELAVSHGERRLEWLERAGLLEGGRHVELVAEGATVDRLRVVCD